MKSLFFRFIFQKTRVIWNFIPRLREYLQTKDRKACFTYGAHTIKKLLDQKGKVLEFRVAQELEQQDCFDEIQENGNNKIALYV